MISNSVEICWTEMKQQKYNGDNNIRLSRKFCCLGISSFDVFYLMFCQGNWICIYVLLDM